MGAYNVTPQLPSNDYTIAEVFAGGGLLAVGLKAAGYAIEWANDFEKAAVQAYRHNLGDHITLGDITQIDSATIPDTDIIAGGPPCQDYSVAGLGAGEDGDKGRLVWTYLGIIERKQPKAFIFENVKGLVQKKHLHTFNALLEEFDTINYNVSWKVINAWDYGVAQKRERVFIVGIRKDLGFQFEFPEPKPEDYRTKVLRDVIGDLPEPVEQINGGLSRKTVPVRGAEWDRRQPGWNNPAKTVAVGGGNGGVNPPVHPGNNAEWYFVENHNSGKVGEHVSKAEHKADMNAPGPVITTQFRCQSVSIENHDPKPLSDHVSTKLATGGYDEYLRKHPPGTMDAPSTAVLTQWEKGAPNGLVYPENHEGARQTEEYGQRETGVGRHSLSSMSDAAYTVVASTTGGKNAVSTNPPRRFTVRECLRIQSVPDWYVLPDDISLSAQYRIVGNGVASRVGYLLGIALAEQLRANEKDERNMYSF